MTDHQQSFIFLYQPLGKYDKCWLTDERKQQTADYCGLMITDPSLTTEVRKQMTYLLFTEGDR